MIDSHCHLDFAQFDEQRNAVLTRCQQLGFEALVIPGVDANGWDRLLQLCACYPLLRPALGLHPMFMARHQREDLARLEQLLAEQPVVAVGEIGLDFYRDRGDAELQLRIFEAQVKLAQQFRLPLILHVRKAHDQVLSLLRRVRFAHGGIVHAYSGSEQQARAYLALGFKLGVGGAATYERAKKLQRLLASLPLESWVLETDAPDMAPAFARGETNSPLNLPRIAEHIALHCGVSLEVLLTTTAASVRQVLPRLAD